MLAPTRHCRCRTYGGSSLAKGLRACKCLTNLLGDVGCNSDRASFRNTRWADGRSVPPPPRQRKTSLCCRETPLSPCSPTLAKSIESSYWQEQIAYEREQTCRRAQGKNVSSFDDKTKDTNLYLVDSFQVDDAEDKDDNHVAILGALRQITTLLPTQTNEVKKLCRGGNLVFKKPVQSWTGKGERGRKKKKEAAACE